MSNTAALEQSIEARGKRSRNLVVVGMLVVFVLTLITAVWTYRTADDLTQKARQERRQKNAAIVSVDALCEQVKAAGRQCVVTPEQVREATTGDPGKPGLNGKDGAPGPKGDKGDKGEPGVAGPAGAKGDLGAKGDTGGPGPSGANGTDGVNGVNGQDGAPGKDGTNGQDGAPGPQGPAGQDAPSSLTLTTPDGVTYVCPRQAGQYVCAPA